MPRGRRKKQDVDTELDSIAHVSSEESKSVSPLELLKEPPDFDLLSNSDKVSSAMMEALLNAKGKNKNKKTSFMSLGDLEHTFVDYRHFALQMLLSAKGMIPGTVIEVLGPESTGKTSLMIYLMGCAIDKGSPCLYINSESKWLSKSRMLRILSEDKQKAAKMLHLISRAEIYELKHMIEAVEEWVASMRDNPVIPREVPLIVGVDTISKLMPPGEASGIYAEGGYMSDAAMKKMKDIGDSSNLEFSKLMHAWCRRLPYWLRKNNVILLINSHQNQKVNMSSFGGGSMIPADVAAEYNKTKIGGNALNQNALTQIILKYEGQEKKGTEPIGKKIKARVIKNTAGAENETLSYLIRTKEFNDTESSYDPCMDFSYGFATAMANKPVPIQVTLYGKQISCKELGLIKSDPKEFSDAFHANKQILNSVAKILEVQGYEGVSPYTPTTSVSSVVDEEESETVVISGFDSLPDFEDDEVES